MSCLFKPETDACRKFAGMKMTHTGSKTTRHSCDILIAGAGPVGLFLACELALAGCSVRVLEKSETASSPLKRLPFGIRGLSSPTIDTLYRRGLLEELQVHKRLKDPHQRLKGETTRRQAGHFARIPFYDEDIDTSAWPVTAPYTHMLSEMEELETVLIRRAEALGVEIRWGMAVTDVRQTSENVAVKAGGQWLESQWLAGCDGGRSAVRKAGGFDFAGTEPELTGYSVQAEIADPEKLQPGGRQTPAGMYLPSQPGYLVMYEYDGGAGHQESVSRRQVQDALRRVSGTDVTIRELHMVATSTDRARQATSYRNGRIFLAGDAAHIHAPLGGQGLNLGLGDAMNLGWKLAAAVHGQVPAGLLDSYHAERHPIGRQVLDWSRAQVALMRPDPGSQALHALVSNLMHMRDGATYMARRVWGISTNDNPDDRPGLSVPDFMTKEGIRLGEQMADGWGVLLDFQGNAELKMLTGDYHRLKYVTGSSPESSGVSALLVRPDGIVAWATDGIVSMPELRETADRWFSRVSV